MGGCSPATKDSNPSNTLRPGCDLFFGQALRPGKLGRCEGTASSSPLDRANMKSLLRHSAPPSYRYPSLELPAVYVTLSRISNNQKSLSVY